MRANPPRGRTINLGICAVAGIVFLAALAAGGHPGLGLLSLAIMIAFGLGVYVLAGRNETAAGMFDRRDERWSAIDVRATACSGTAVGLAVIAAAVWELAHGRSGEPFTVLAAIGGVAYLVSFLILRSRS